MQLPEAILDTGGQLPGTEGEIAGSGGLLPGARGGPEAGAEPAPPGRPCGGGGASTGPPRTARAPASLPAAVPSSLRRGRTGRTGAAPHRAAPRRAEPGPPSCNAHPPPAAPHSAALGAEGHGRCAHQGGPGRRARIAVDERWALA